MTVRLLPLVLSASFGEDLAGPAGTTLENFDDHRCPFCGMHSGRRHDSAAACALCFLCRHLERPRIDEEAVLVWLPEMGQSALNVTIREVDVQLRTLGEDLYDAGRLRLDRPERLRLHHARAVLGARAAAAANRLGTDKPSGLASALCRLSLTAYANRAKLLHGVRLLPLGRFYIGSKNAYPEIVDSWRERAKPPEAPASVSPRAASGG